MTYSTPLQRLRHLVDLVDDAGSDEAGQARARAQASAVLTGPRADGALSSELDAAADRAARGLAQAVLAQGPDVARRTELRAVVGDAVRAAAQLPGRVNGELRHILLDRPRTVMVRLAVTLALSLAMVSFYQVAGWSSHNARTLTLYLFAAVVGSVVCTNALCFDAPHVRARIADGDDIWRILVVKNIAMAALITTAAAPVIALLHVTSENVNAVILLDQLVAMLFIWMGVANVLSILSPLRHESLGARLHDGTWLPFLLSFVISYGVGLTVNVMIYWRLWARQAAAQEVTGGAWTAFLLVLSSSALTWMLLTVFAVSCARHPVLHRILLRELTTAAPAKARKAAAAGTDEAWPEGTVGAAMLRRPTFHPADLTVGGARAALAASAKLHLILLERDGRLVGTLDRDDVPAGRDDEPALAHAELDGRTVRADAPLGPLRSAMIADGVRRLAVVDDAGRLLGLLCLKASATGFCTDEGVDRLRRSRG